MDDKDREKFYTPPAPPADDDGEYELEPPDEAVTEHQRKATLAGIEKRIDINEIYAEADRDRGSEILEDWVRNFRFRFQFQVKHLLIATALLAIVLTLFKLGMFWPTLVVLIMLGVAGLYTYLVWEEKKHQAEAARKREIVYAQRRAQQAASQSGGIAETTEPLTTAPAEIPPSSEIDEAWRAARREEAISLSIFAARDDHYDDRRGRCFGIDPFPGWTRRHGHGARHRRAHRTSGFCGGLRSAADRSARMVARPRALCGSQHFCRRLDQLRVNVYVPTVSTA